MVFFFLFSPLFWGGGLNFSNEVSVELLLSRVYTQFARIYVYATDV